MGILKMIGRIIVAFFGIIMMAFMFTIMTIQEAWAERKIEKEKEKK